MADLGLKDVLAVVVIYNCRAEKSATLVTLNQNIFTRDSCLDIIIYDNSPEVQKDDSLSSLSNLSFEYFHDSTNPGVSKSYNRAANLAVKRGKQFLLLLDQDTSFPPDSLIKYTKAINLNKDILLFCPILKTKLGIYSPSKYYFRRGMNWQTVSPGIYNLKNKTVLNSGMLISTSAFRSLSGYNEKIQLYFSDFDFINRFRRKYDKMVVLDLYCYHSLSDIDNKDTSSAITRFNYYVAGSYNSGITFIDYFFLFSTVFLRAAKLSIKFKSIVFLKVFFKRYLFGKS